MKLLKPSWVNHDDKPIFSVDIHPTGKRFATGGQGGDSGRVVVWNLNPVLFEAVEVDPNVPKMLCQMDNHLACVNCVRWSNGGKYLASGGDDRLVMVWGLSVAAMGTPGKHKAETWRCLATLRGHAGDVLDLAWSPLDKWLASCSVDNSIIIWNAEKFPEMVCVLNGHSGLVKGVAWDPVGKYLASQSDDKSLRVWKTADWAPEIVITEPFEECGGTTHVLRLSWSPDGQYVLSAHAMNGGGPTAQVVERDGWRCDKDFVGHRKAVTCARFNSNIFVKEGKKCCCAAVGSRDRALSIWLTSLKRPLVVVHDLFSDSVLDLSWSSDGLNLLACSSDGTVACIQFTNKEIGTPLTIEEKNAFYEKIYGKCLANESGGDLSANLLVECPEILLAREKEDAKKQAAKEETTPKSEKSQSTILLSPSAGSSNTSTPLRPMDRQIETRTSDGKRRITPVFIPLTQVHANESLGSQPGGTENCFSTSSQSKSRIKVEVRDDIIIHPNVSNHATSTQQNNSRTSENGLDQRLRKRGAASLPGPRADELAAKRPCGTTPATPLPAGALQYVAALPAPALGTAGPVVRAAGQLRLQASPLLCTVQHACTPLPAGALQYVAALPAPAHSTAVLTHLHTPAPRYPPGPCSTWPHCGPCGESSWTVETTGKSSTMYCAARLHPATRRGPAVRGRTAGPVVRAAGQLRLQASPLLCTVQHACTALPAGALHTPAPRYPPGPCSTWPHCGPCGESGWTAETTGKSSTMYCAARLHPATRRGPAVRGRTAGPVVRAAGQLRLQASPLLCTVQHACTPLPAGALQYVAALPAPAHSTAVVNKACNTQYGTLSRLQLLPNNSASSDPVWETYLGSAVTCIACDVRWACVACADGTLHAWRLARHTARRALPPIALMSQAAKLTLSGDTLAVVSTSAELAMWELSTATCVIRPLCFRALLSQGVTVTNCSLLDDGNPMISLSNGKSYIYSKGLCAWVVWADACDPVWRCSGAATNTRVPKAPLYPLARVNRNRPSSFASSSYSAGAARSWLEAQVASCLHLRLARDYRHWLTQLFTHLVNHGTEDQLRTILDDMLGPSHCTSTPKKWQSSILGIKKHELLEEMLSLLIRELRWQRMYAEYNDQLTEMKSQGTVVNGH
ncbi:hypothetical protein PYW07_003604 [Mythimna separata]|uniref:Protein HIRA n=1 Tax=Mythimna separata TaxID=271217 RepID=A0AAD7YPA1_MYTSE|nr:hypothetical protein PYW07_003604 [Mythimna separata]